MSCRLHCVLLFPLLACGEYRGGALVQDRVFAWGAEGLHEIDPATRTARRLATGIYGDGGCSFDAGVVVHEPAPELGALVRFQAPLWQREVIDSGANAAECLEATLFGRHGLLVVHRNAQIRFYEPHAPARGGRWPYREIYSIYTPSDQAGLLVTDVDGDRLPDILCGNYWIQSPTAFDRPWRLFAINNWWEGPQSAKLRIVREPAPPAQMRIVVAQSSVANGLLSRFVRPADPKQFWQENRMEVPGGVHSVGAMIFHEGKLYVGERRGAQSRSRLLVLQDGKVVSSRRSNDVLGLWIWRGRVLVLEPDGLTYF